jgi:hypothetical protein
MEGDQLMIARGVPDVSNNPSFMFAAKNFIVREQYLLNIVNGGSLRKVAMYEGERSVPLDFDATLYVWDGTFEGMERACRNFLALDSIGSGHERERGSELFAFAPLPTPAEVDVIGNQCLKNQGDFFVIYDLIGPNLRECARKDLRSVRKARCATLTKLTVSDFNPKTTNLLNDKQKSGIRAYFVQLVVIVDAQEKGLWKYGDYCLALSTVHALTDIYNTILKSNMSQANTLVHLFYETFGSGSLFGWMAEKAFGKQAKKYGIKVAIRDRKDSAEREGSEVLDLTFGDWNGGDDELFDLVPLGTECQEGLPEPQPDGAAPIFFRPRQNQPLYDFALVTGTVVHLFQVTVSDNHTIRMDTLNNVIGTFSARGKEKGKVHFCMIRAALCPMEHDNFRKRSHVIPEIRAAEDRKKFLRALQKERVLYSECLWDLYSQLGMIAKADADIGNGNVASQGSLLIPAPSRPKDAAENVAMDDSDTW